MHAKLTNAHPAHIRRIHIRLFLQTMLNNSCWILFISLIQFLVKFPILLEMQLGKKIYGIKK